MIFVFSPLMHYLSKLSEICQIVSSTKQPPNFLAENSFDSNEFHIQAKQNNPIEKKIHNQAAKFWIEREERAKQKRDTRPLDRQKNYFEKKTKSIPTLVVTHGNATRDHVPWRTHKQKQPALPIQSCEDFYLLAKTEAHSQPNEAFRK